MKTEKRLTMALSVLVALMMLAVPLASSSNLFVDGGQTNSNGDAPVVGASTGYTITFQLNADGKSLDQIENLNDIIAALNDTDSNSSNGVTPAVAGATWYLNENGDLCALVMYEKGVTEVKLSELIKALYNGTDSKISKGAAYKLISWKDTTTGSTYDSTITNDDIIKKDMAFISQWELQSGYVEVPVTVNFDGDVKEYIKAYAYADGKIIIGSTDGQIDDSALVDAVEKVGKLSINGVVVNGADFNPIPVYSEGKVTYGDNKELPADGKTIPSTSKLTVTYTFNDSKFSKIVVSSIAFKGGKDVTLYADTASDYTYKQVFDALIAAKNVELVTSGAGSYDKTTGKIVNEDNTVLTSDKHYVLSKWNGTEYLNSTRTAPATLTLDAKLNGYSIAFMSKGQYEVKFVEFGKLTADACSLDVSGLDHWVMITPTALDNATSTSGAVTASIFEQFNFASESNIKKIETAATTGTYKVDEPVYVLIACFTSSDKTAYAVFDASNGKTGADEIIGNFGNEYINRIVVPGEISKSDDAKNSIPSPSATPVYDEGNIFIGWGENNYDTNKNSVKVVNASVSSYKYTITFYDGNNVLGMFYMKTGANLTNEATFKGDIVAIQYNGQLYGAPTGDHVEGKYQSIDAYNDLVFSKKNGYEIKQWNDANKNSMIIFKLNDDKVTIIDKVNIKDMKDNLSLYGQFEAKKYLIAYNGNTATATNNMPQEGTVDSAVNLFSDAAFSNDGYKLKEWNTRPDGKGTSYALGVSFTLTGEQYEDLKGVPTGNGLPSGYEKGFTLYAIWEKSSSGSGSGDNNEGNDGNNTDTYLLAGILAVIIILIILIAFLMRRKQ